MRKKVIHLLSCQTAKELGPDLVKNGACAYFGYYENFTITWNHPNVFWICDSAIDLALCNGLNAENAAKVAIHVYRYWIKKMRAIHGPTATWLTWDLKALRTPIHGSKYGKRSCTLKRIPFFEDLEAELMEEELEEPTTIELDDFIASMTDDLDII